MKKFFISVVVCTTLTLFLYPFSTNLDKKTFEQAHEITLPEHYFSESDYNYLIENQSQPCVYISDTIKNIVASCCIQEPTLCAVPNIESFINDSTHVLPHEKAHALVTQLVDFLNTHTMHNQTYSAWAKELHAYNERIVTNNARIFVEILPEEAPETPMRSKQCNNKPAKIYCNEVFHFLRANSLQVTGNTTIDGNLTVKGTINGVFNLTFVADSGNAVPAAGIINVLRFH